MAGRRQTPLTGSLPDGVRQFVMELRSVQAASNLTLHQLAKRSQSSPSTLSRYLNGQTLPSEPTLLAFLQAVGVPPEENDVWMSKLRAVRKSSQRRPSTDEERLPQAIAALHTAAGAPSLNELADRISRATGQRIPRSTLHRLLRHPAQHPERALVMAEVLATDVPPEARRQTELHVIKPLRRLRGRPAIADAPLLSASRVEPSALHASDLESLLADSERLLGPDHPDTLRARANLALLYAQAGRDTDAVALQEQVLTKSERLLGPDHPDTLRARANLARSYAQTGRDTDAVALQEQVLTKSERLLGPDHPDTLRARANLARSYAQTGRDTDAVALQEQVLTKSERLLGPDHPDTLRARANLARSYAQTGRDTDAVALQEQVLTKSERLLGPDHPDTLRARANLARSYAQTGRDTDAEQLLETVIADSARMLGDAIPRLPGGDTSGSL